MKAQLMKVLAIAVPLLILLAILDFAGLTQWLLYPVSSAKKAFSSGQAAG